MAFISVSAAGDLEQMIAKLGLYRPLYRVDLGAEYDLVEFPNHHARSEFSEVTALPAGGT